MTPFPRFLRPHSPKLVRQIDALLNDRRLNSEQRREGAAILLADWLATHGRFIRTTENGRFYLFQPTARLFAYNTARFTAWIAVQTGVNSASANFKHLMGKVESLIEHDGDQVEVVRVAHWEEDTQTLRISRFDGWVYRLDGLTIDTERNGEGPILFNDQDFWEPYAPDFTGNGDTLRWSLRDLARWQTQPESCTLLFTTWWLSTFFSELCSTRPLLVMKGEKGSGKSMACRILLRLLFGRHAEVTGAPDKVENFPAMVAANHVLVLDNLDELHRDLRDKLARLSTGGIDQVRRLYTTHDVETIRYRCWCAITARTPDTLQRDDLIDRLIVLPLERVPDVQRRGEAGILADARRRRNLWWGDLLTTLNAIVLDVRRHGIEATGGLRIEDWAAFAATISRSLGQFADWPEASRFALTGQAALLLDEDVLVQALEAWVAQSLGPTKVTLPTRALYTAVQSALYPNGNPDANWPKSVKSFGRRLAGMFQEVQRHLLTTLDVSMDQQQYHNQTALYSFERVQVQQPPTVAGGGGTPNTPAPGAP